MGLGLLGRGLGYTKFLAQCGADLIVTDLKNSDQLATSVKALSKFPNIKFVLGEHRLEDFRDRDMIVKSAGVPMDSVFIAEAIKSNIPIEMDVSLFAKCAPGVQIVGVTGTRGKSMTTNLIYEILKSQEKFLNKSVFIGGNVRGVATLPLLSKVKDGDILVAELDSWQLQGFGPTPHSFLGTGEHGFSPHISVFTSFMTDHMNYYRDNMDLYFADKANIFKYQKAGDTLVISPGMKKLIPKDIKSKLTVVKPNTVSDWKFAVPGVHQMENMACAVEVVKLFGIPESKIKKAVKDFKGLEGRLELVKNIRGIKIYNDNNATTPEATISGLEALSPKQGLGLKKIVLICGGNDKNIPVTDFVKAINKYCKFVVTIPGTGTDKLLSQKLKVESIKTENLKQAFATATSSVKKGDIILFSPAFSSFSQYNNEYERNDEFVKLVKKFK